MDVAGEFRQGRIREEASLEVLDGPTALADQVMMVSRELLGQLEALTPAEGRAEAQGRCGSNELQPHQHVDRSVDGHDVRLATAEPRVDLRHRQRHAAIREDIEDCAPRAGQSQPSTREEVR
jgi:hypothetical protein